MGGPDGLAVGDHEEGEEARQVRRRLLRGPRGAPEGLSNSISLPLPLICIYWARMASQTRSLWRFLAKWGLSVQVRLDWPPVRVFGSTSANGQSAGVKLRRGVFEK